MRSVPSFIGAFEKKEKTGRIRTVKQELPIEREASVRHQKKQILQRLKKAPIACAADTQALDIQVESCSDSEAASAAVRKESTSSKGSNKNYFTEAGRAGISSSRRSNEDLNIPSVDTSVTCTLEQQTEKREAPGSVEQRRDTNTTGNHAQKLDKSDETTEHRLYVPSFVSDSPRSPEYRRKTDEIKRKAAERRKVVERKEHRSFTDINMLINSAPITSESAQLPTSSLNRSGSAPIINVEDTEEDRGHAAQETEGSRNLLLTPRPTRASSYSSIHETSSTFGEDLHFKDIARKQQEQLEDDFRRVEDCLNQTFSELRRYLKTS